MPVNECTICHVAGHISITHDRAKLQAFRGQNLQQNNIDGLPDITALAGNDLHEYTEAFAYISQITQIKRGLWLLQPSDLQNNHIFEYKKPKMLPIMPISWRVMHTTFGLLLKELNSVNESS